MSRPGLRLVGLMAYESQIAGVGDNPPGRPLYARAIRIMQRKSAAELADRRAAIVAAIRQLTPLEFVNGGGTGRSRARRPSQPSRRSARVRACITRRCSTPTADSPASPAAMFALPVVRRPGPGVVTALGGGYPASGPGAPSRRSVAVPARRAAAGQGGRRRRGADAAASARPPTALRIGDKVWMRHAKAGELCERFTELHLVDGESVVATVPTYRGEGQNFG